MSNDVSAITKTLMETAKAKGFDTGQIAGIMGSPEGRVLMDRLNGPDGGVMKDAAAKAAEGNPEALSSLLGALMETKEGKSVARQVMKMKK